METILALIIAFLVYKVYKYSKKRNIKKQYEKDYEEALKRRRYVNKLSEVEIIAFVKKNGFENSLSWFNYKGILKESHLEMKYYIVSGWEDNECYVWYELRRSVDNKCIFPTLNF
jgi:hypothetical protein